jgi:hypothetical protein
MLNGPWQDPRETPDDYQMHRWLLGTRVFVSLPLGPDEKGHNAHAVPLSIASTSSVAQRSPQSTRRDPRCPLQSQCEAAVDGSVSMFTFEARIVEGRSACGRSGRVHRSRVRRGPRLRPCDKLNRNPGLSSKASAGRYRTTSVQEAINSSMLHTHARLHRGRHPEGLMDRHVRLNTTSRSSSKTRCTRHPTSNHA